MLDSLEAWRRESVQKSYQITEKIGALDMQLQNTQQFVSKIHGDEYWNKLRDLFTQISSKVHQLSRSHSIVASLRYDCMDIRQEAIRAAHTQTFHWVYQPHAHNTSSQSMDIGFAEWLQHGTGIYWVTGKPGKC
jgi:hypothetical protein